jgi:hypothetical protein
MPNGNVLILAWEFRSQAECIAAGRDPSQLSQGELWPEHIIEVEPKGSDGGTIVWEWHAWDHLIQDFDPDQDNHGVVADHPELIDINHMQGSNADWMHANAIDYNPELDQILINSPFLGEFWIIDHSTTTEEAAGHTGGNCGRGGDILYRWGNPQAYDRGTSDDRKFYNHHDARWIDAGLPGAGNFLVFNNGNGRPEGPFTTIEEIVPPVDEDGCYELERGLAYGPDEPMWIYMADPPTDFYSSFISGATRQPNGNTLICSGAWGEIFEVTPDLEPDTVWFYVSPVTSNGPVMQGVPIPPQGNSSANRMLRAERYPPDFPGFDGKDLTPMGPIETYPPSCTGDITGGPGGGPDGVVDVSDLVMVILNWGTSGLGADIADPEDVVDVNDLVAVILAWGPCP